MSFPNHASSALEESLSGAAKKLWMHTPTLVINLKWKKAIKNGRWNKAHFDLDIWKAKKYIAFKIFYRFWAVWQAAGRRYFTTATDAPFHKIFNQVENNIL